ncbi:MAG: DegT/DnrJ/EryC1/StrS family aminotransferase [Clostridiales bacterium]|nr:DegT/DnrJ/EryC1/StrS family aminotransferase [Clostridiales bacterium]
MYRIGQEEKDAVARVIDSRELFKINRAEQETEKCEEALREKFGVKRTILMTSGTSALTSALIGMGIGPGDEVIVPAYTYIATAMAVVATGAIPIIADIDETCTISPEEIEKNITDRTKCIIPVHIQGLPCDMDRVMAIAKKHGLFVLEDACQADGGSYKGKRLGTIGDAGALSFNQFKIITAGEGGALLTDNETIFQRGLIYHDSSAIAFFGNQLDGITEPQFCGTEFRTNEVAAAILRQQLLKLDGILDDLRKNKKALTERLEGRYTIGKSNDIEGDCSVALPVVLDSEAEGRKFCETFGHGAFLPIDTGKHIYTHWTAILETRGALNPKMDPFKHPDNVPFVPDYSKVVCPVTLDRLSRTAFIPIDPEWTPEEIDEIAGV